MENSLTDENRVIISCLLFSENVLKISDTFFNRYNNACFPP
ncbi:MAG: hypothetical protein AVDCRST_MAG74-3287 [uncultured Pyrinomonadaceae bacterium]|uniref:Uncharacterized protein n=1 Tax=uncultured Pyrinomonadaceae bacterium TaxID=2283094 RepID=A0A6J4PWM9_9BACT|nr:MAG: hypothetical protein AVDCRST_MAG74-3287 [uncultured Pyrinomonadaceae bacterium]